MVVFLKTERLVLRRFTEADVDNLVELDNDPEVMRYITGVPTSRHAIETDFLPSFLAYYNRYDGYGFWAAIEKSSGDFLGWFHFRPEEDAASDEPELGYRLRRSAWGKGYATEASRTLINKGFTELGAKRVNAWAAADNIASRRVMEKSGMVLVQTICQVWPGLFNGEKTVGVEYALNKSDWLQQQALPLARRADAIGLGWSQAP